MHFEVDKKSIDYQEGDTVLSAMLRAGEHPNNGGCLCFAGDCSYCIATVNGVSYVRTCQTAPSPRIKVELHPSDACPPLPDAPRQAKHTPIEYQFCQVAVILHDQDPDGLKALEQAQESGKATLSFAHSSVVGIYAGPLLVIHHRGKVLHVRVSEKLIVASGAAHIQPVVPGSDLRGLFTPTAIQKAKDSSVALGKIIAVGPPPDDLECEGVQGTLLRFEGDEKKRVKAVIMKGHDGIECRHPCNSVSISLGTHPRNQLALMASDLPLEVEVVGAASTEASVPTCPKSGTICACTGVTRNDLDFTWDSGFREMELIKRSTLAGTGTCQGMACLPYLRGFIQERGGELQPRFTARPMVNQLTLGEMAAGAHHHPDLRTPLHDEHLKLKAWMERLGPWWRPWNYGNPIEEYWAVRQAVSIMDVSTLGKFIVSGPDALAFLNKIYPTDVSTLKTGRCRYALLLDERGYVFDDGLISKESEAKFHLTFTSSGSSHAEMWLRDWAQAFSMDVRILNHTYSTAAINVTGPLSFQLLKELGLDDPMSFMSVTESDIAEIPCRVHRLSFTGELSYELHHPVHSAPTLWRSLLEHGSPLGIKPHGFEALDLLRLEKGHIIVHQDTDFDSTPKRVNHEWAVKMQKEQFLGRQALVRTADLPADKVLCGFEMSGSTAPMEGATIWHQDEYAGFVTSVGYSHSLEKSIMLGHLAYFDGELPTRVTIDGRTAIRTKLPFYDPSGERARA